MRNSVLCVFLLSLIVLRPLCAQQESAPRTGWISDEACGALHTKAGKESCVEKCWRGGASVGHPEWKPQRAVFVADGDHAMWVIENAAAVKGYPGAHVELAGKFDVGRKTVQVVEIKRIHKEE